jgi:hypothetical protein
VQTDWNRQGELQHTFYSLNEFIVNRGLSGVLSTLEVYVDGQLVTTAQGDGTLQQYSHLSFNVILLFCIADAITECACALSSLCVDNTNASACTLYSRTLSVQTMIATTRSDKRQQQRSIALLQ